jgi:hypothetical protein
MTAWAVRIVNSPSLSCLAVAALFVVSGVALYLILEGEL